MQQPFLSTPLCLQQPEQFSYITLREMWSLPSGACSPFRKIDTWMGRFLENSVVAERYREGQLMPGGREGAPGLSRTG